MEPLKASVAHVTKHADDEGRTWWALVVQGRTVCETQYMRKMLGTAKNILGRVTLSVWDAEKDKFTSVLLTDENW